MNACCFIVLCVWNKAYALFLMVCISDKLYCFLIACKAAYGKETGRRDVLPVLPSFESLDMRKVAGNKKGRLFCLPFVGAEGLLGTLFLVNALRTRSPPSFESLRKGEVDKK